MSIRRRLHALRRKIRYWLSEGRRRIHYRAKRHRFGGYDVEVRWHAPRQRLENYLARVFDPVDRGVLRAAIVEQRILVDMRPVEVDHRVQMYERIQILEPALGRVEIRGHDLAIPILWEDEDLVVVDKPARMLTHPNIDNRDASVIGGLAFVGKLHRPEIFTFEAGVVHRLDHPTSGCLCVARTERGQRAMRRLFRRRQVDKTYLALVSGRLEGSGTIDQPIGRDPDHHSRRRVDLERGKRSVTHYRALESDDAGSLVELDLETGRTHQIRVHLAHLGHPIAGDRLYGRRRQEASRVLLHARRLAFRHPLTGQRLEIEAPVPADFREWRERMAAASGVPKSKNP